jgi:branched-chain amino acid transport system ATP-binding protein
MAPLIETRDLTRHFGGLRAVDGVDFFLTAGEIHGLDRPERRGKDHLRQPSVGPRARAVRAILLGGEDITRLPAHVRVRKGIAYTFQITSIFPRLSVFDNVALAVQSQGRDLTARTRAALARVGLQGLEEQEAQTLSYGHQRLLEVAMGLALNPRVLILDEPTQGLAASEIEGFKTLVRSLVPETTVLLIEHNMEVVMDLATRITVLTFGRVLATGTPAEIRANSAVQEAYLGA